MQKQHLLSEIHLRNLQVIQNIPSARKTNRPPNSNRTLMKLYLTNQILQECLHTLDIFKQILEDPIQKNKLIRDVNKNLKLKIYDQDAIIYNKGEISEGFYMVIKGKVSLCLPISNTDSENSQNTDIYEGKQQEINTFEEGVGFGQAQFIHGKKRSLLAKAKVNNTVIGMIEGLAFQEIIQLYKQRVYYKKLDMFSNCQLLQHLQPYQFQFVVNNAKPITIPIFKQIIRQNENPKQLYLITEGQVILRRTQQISKKSSSSKYNINGKQKLQEVLKQKIKLKSIVVGTLQAGEFIGDSQLAMNIPYSYSAYSNSQKVRLYVCDQRIITSQMGNELLKTVYNNYSNKNIYRQNKSQIYRCVKSKLQKYMQNQQKSILTQQQKKIKKMIANRYVQKVPSAIGCLSPREISKIIDKKYSKMKSQPSNKKTNYLPQISMIEPIKKLKVDQRSYSPLLKKYQQKNLRKYTQPDQSGLKKQKTLETISYDQKYQYEQLNGPNQYRRSSTSKPLLVFMRPFAKKVFSLHQRLSDEYRGLDCNKKQKNKSRQNIDNNFSIIEMKRVYQFVNKLKNRPIN